MSISPLVSVVVPVHDRAPIVCGAVRSVLDQGYGHLELIVVDDGSRDDLAAALSPFRSDPRLRLLVQENAGVSAARNRGIDAARGAFLAFLDSDDRWLPDKLERQVAAALARARPERAFVTGLTEVRGEGGTQVVPARPMRAGEAASDYLYGASGYVQASAIFTGAPLARAVRFREGLNQYEDHLFFLEAAAAGADVVQLDRVVVVVNDEARPDRLSRAKTAASARRFRAAAGDALTPRAAAAFDAYEIAPELWPRAPLAALALHVRALRLGAAPPRKLLACLARTVLSPTGHARLQRALVPRRRSSGARTA